MPIRWFDPYIYEHNNLGTAIYTSCAHLFNNVNDEMSPLEAVLVAIMIRTMSGLDRFDIRDVLEVTPYNHYRQLLQRVISSVNPDLFDERMPGRRVSDIVKTAFQAQGSENWVVIVSVGRHPNSIHMQGNTKYLFDDHRLVYTACSRAKQHLYIVGCAHTIGQSSRAWCRLLRRMLLID